MRSKMGNMAAQCHPDCTGGPAADQLAQSAAPTLRIYATSAEIVSWRSAWQAVRWWE